MVVRWRGVVTEQLQGLAAGEQQSAGVVELWCDEEDGNGEDESVSPLLLRPFPYIGRQKGETAAVIPCHMASNPYAPPRLR